MIPARIFISDPTDSSSRIYYVNNNPIIAPPRHPLIVRALERATMILTSSSDRPDIQSTTGPGNMAASLVFHDMAAQRLGRPKDFALIADWDAISVSKWPLGYRNDERNWRFGQDMPR
jgi:hypothetical protein